MVSANFVLWATSELRPTNTQLGKLISCTRKQSERTGGRDDICKTKIVISHLQRAPVVLGTVRVNWVQVPPIEPCSGKNRFLCHRNFLKSVTSRITAGCWMNCASNFRLWFCFFNELLNYRAPEVSGWDFLTTVNSPTLDRRTLLVHRIYLSPKFDLCQFRASQQTRT